MSRRPAEVTATVDQSHREQLPIASARRSWSVLGRAVLRRPGQSTGALLTTAVGAAAGLVAPWALGRLVDDVTAGASTADVWRAVALVGGSALAGAALLGLGRVLLTRVGESVLAGLREQVLARVLRLPSARVARVGSGDVLSRVGDDVGTVTQALTTIGPQVVTAGVTVLLTVAGIAGLDWRLGLVALVTLPFYVHGLRWYLPASGPLYAEERRLLAHRAQALVDAVHGGETVRAHRLEDAQLAVVSDRSAAARDMSIGVYRLATRFFTTVNKAELAGLAAILTAGFLLVRADAVTVGATTAAALYFHRLFGPLGLLLMTFDQIQSAGASTARLVGVLDADTAADADTDGSPDADAAPDAARSDHPVAPPPVGPHRIEISGVSHRYDDGPVVLDDVSLSIAAGERVALVGASGAGKTTLARVVAGALSPSSGTVRIGGNDVAVLGEQRVAEYLCLVSQEVHVFAGPVAEDLRLARPEASDADIARALQLVGASWVSRLPGGAATVVGEGAHPVTAPQAQQLALARVALADPGAVVLDEATAEAGSAGARDLEDAADAVVRGRTSLVVAHRLTQARTADRIAVMEAGAIVEVGSHDELLALDGRYAALWAAWHG